MSDWEIMAHQITLPIGAEKPYALPAGWEPIGTLSRQGNEAVVLCRRVAENGDTPAPPVIDTLQPATVPAGSPPATVDIWGSGFDPACLITLNGKAVTTFHLDAAHLQFTARADQATAGDFVDVVVVNDNGDSSNAVEFDYT